VPRVNQALAESCSTREVIERWHHLIAGTILSERYLREDELLEVEETQLGGLGRDLAPAPDVRAGRCVAPIEAPIDACPLVIPPAICSRAGSRAFWPTRTNLLELTRHAMLKGEN